MLPGHDKVYYLRKYWLFGKPLPPLLAPSHLSISFFHKVQYLRYLISEVGHVIQPSPQQQPIMSKVILVTGATGKQGGAVINALLKDLKHCTILAVTRDPNSEGSKKLALKSSSIKLVQGNLDDVPSIFKTASGVVKEPIWGVYSVQLSMGKGVTFAGEIAQGKALVDESVKTGVKYFVYSSVDRGGDEKSWVTKTPILHFQTKFEIEHHLRGNAGEMGWTILRPVAFMEVGCGFK